MKAQGTLNMHGNLKTKIIRAPKAPLSWRIRNAIRPAYWLGFLAVIFAKMFSKMTGILVMTSKLSVVKITADGKYINYGVVGFRVVTTAFVNYLVDAFQNSVELENLKYHGLGTGTNAEAVGDTALQTELTTELNPDSTRATGTTTEGASANIYRSVATNTVDSAVAVTEHGVFSQAATGGGTLLDRTVFSVINLGSGDSLQTTYELTCTAGS